MVTRLWIYLVAGLSAAACVLMLCSSQQGGAAESLPKPQSLHVPVRQVDVRKLPGTYYHFQTRLTINSDGTYVADLHGCRGLYGEAAGKWRLSASTLILSPLKETGTMSRITVLDVLERGDSEVVFVAPERHGSLKSGVRPSTCFMRIDKMRKQKA